MQSEKSRTKGRRKRMNGKIGEEFIKKPFQNITLNIPEIFDEMIQKLIKLKIFPTRSEAVRVAISNGLKKSKKILEDMKKESDMETGKIKILTVNVIKEHVTEIGKIVDERAIHTSRSEFAREAIKDLIVDNMKYILDPEIIDNPQKTEKMEFKVIRKLDNYQRPTTVNASTPCTIGKKKHSSKNSTKKC